MTEFSTPRTELAQPHTSIITAGGWARSGKGTTMTRLKGSLEDLGQQVILIDQGLKFRAMAEVALDGCQDLDSPTALGDFIASPAARTATLAVIDEALVMSDEEKSARLYTTEVSRASGRVGGVASSHNIAIELLKSQVEEAVEAQTDVVLIDGRTMEKYARQFDQDEIARFVVGWFFKCDPIIAARRSLKMFAESADLSSEQQKDLLEAAIGISERNQSDSLRTVDPLREPKGAYHLDLATYFAPKSDNPYKRGADILNRGGLAVVDTSYNTIEEMTDPVIELTKHLLVMHRALEPDQAISEPANITA